MRLSRAGCHIARLDLTSTESDIFIINISAINLILSIDLPFTNEVRALKKNMALKEVTAVDLIV